ncbi:MAG TPA: PAS domain-containing protein [Methylomirabilota bacterium]|nr:PAS domain-containing protein [Methylomirabilota bacterium]
MASLVELAWTTNAAARRGEIVEALAEAAAALVEDGLVLAWLLRGEQLVIRAASGALRQMQGGLRTAHTPGEGLIGAAAVARGVTSVADPAAGATRAEAAAFLRAEGVRHFVGVPLAAGYGLQGVLGVFSRREGEVDAALLEKLAALGGQAALSLESARLFADSERRRRAAEGLAAVAQALAHGLGEREVAHLIADSVLALLDARGVAVYRLEPGPGNLVAMAFAGDHDAGFRHPFVLPPGTGVSGRAVLDGRPIRTADVLADPRFVHPDAYRAGLERGGYRAVMAAPLIVDGVAIGALGAAAAPGRTFDEESSRLLEAFADQAALALRNAQLIAGTRSARAEAQAVERRFRDLVEGVDAILTEFDLTTRRAVFVSGGVERLLGYTPEQWMREPDFWRAHIHPDDRERVLGIVTRAVAAGREFVHEYRMLAADGREVWLRDSVTVAGGRLRTLKVDITALKRAEEALRTSEQRYRMLVTNIPDVVWLTDSQGHTVFVSPHVERIGGYTADEVHRAGFSGWLGRVHPDDRPLVQRHFAAIFGGPGRSFDLEYRIQHKDGRWIWLRDRAVTTYEQHGVTYAYGIYTDISDRKRAEDIRALLLNQVITVQEEERRRIARELHDETAQSLASLLLGLSALAETRTVKAARDQARELHQVVTRALAEVRRMAKGLRPSVLDDLGLAAAVARYAGEFGMMRRLAVTVDTAGLGADRLPQNVETALYRIMQEALSNVARHAGARSARVHLDRVGAIVSMTIADDGSGFDPERPPAPATAAHGLGIHTMRERALVLNGSLMIESAPGRGTRVSVEIPLTEGRA